MYSRVWKIIAVLLLGIGVVNAQNTEYTGYIDSTTVSKPFLVELQVGQSIYLIVEATSGDLDTYLTLLDPNGVVVAENDDYGSENYNSALGHTATVGGTYSVVVSRYEFSNTAGNYLLRMEIGDQSVLAELNELPRLTLSGTERIRDTEHFRIHYTLEGIDSTTEAYVEAVANSMELVWRIQVEEQGWPAPPADTGRGGDARYDVYLADLLDDNSDGSVGYTAPDEQIGDNPNSIRIEQHAATSYLVIENDFSEDFSVDGINTTPLTLMRATAAHEFHHAIQFGYDVNDAHSWFYESTASWMETVTLAKDEDATGYVAYNYDYPEICFGTENDPGQGQLQYGDWLFIQSLVDVHGDEFVQRLWEDIADLEGFPALEATLQKYNETIPQALLRYRLKNLFRDYELAPEFGAVVWLENTISSYGRWTFTGLGIQELAANYFDLSMTPGLYSVSIVDGDNNALQLYAVGINGAQGSVIPLDQGGTISTVGYERVYLMVFNPIYDDDTDNCIYNSYSIEVQPGSGQGVSVGITQWNATHFEPLN